MTAMRTSLGFGNGNFLFSASCDTFLVLLRKTQKEQKKKVNKYFFYVRCFTSLNVKFGQIKHTLTPTTCTF